ncbi:uncharacterized protein [Procambarus clarkii]|uniref:uncharacterized protein n=1 Tax=Procambarus clarkii TaxID=6728 RepID=UPI003742527E
MSGNTSPLPQFIEQIIQPVNMERLLRPERSATDPNATTAAQEWRHWLKTFQNFILAVEENTPTVNKLRLLINYVAPRVFNYVADCTTYDAAETSLTELFVKPKKEVFARHVLATRRQEPGESLGQFLQALKLLAKDCQFKAVTAVEACDNYVRDAFINGLGSATIRQRLLENKTLDLQSAFDQAHTLETAQKLSASYAQPRATNAAMALSLDLEDSGGQESVEEKVDSFCSYN